MRLVKISFFVLLLMLVGVTVVAAAPTNNRNYVTPLSGDEEVPARETKAHGTAMFQLSRDGQSISYRLNAFNLTSGVTGAHIHTGTVGTIGPVVVHLYRPQNCITLENGIRCQGTITAADLVGLLAGQPLSALVTLMDEERAYVNVHTTTYTGGEIRGQIDRGNTSAARHSRAGGMATRTGEHGSKGCNGHKP